MSDRKEQFLLLRIRAFHDERAFSDIHDAYTDSLRRYLLGKLPTPEDADDVLADVFLRAWNYFRSAHVDHASGLLFTIARGLVAEHYRARKETVSIDAHAGIRERAGDGGEGAGSLVHDADIALIRRNMDGLSERDQKLITLRYLEGLPPREIARRLGMKEATARMALHRALQRLRGSYDT